MLVILLTGSRKGLLVVALSVVVVRLVTERKKIIRNLLVCTGAALLVYFLIMNVSVLYNIVGVRVESSS